MALGVWKRLPSLLAMRGLLLLGVPSLAVLSFLGVVGWRWLARRMNGGQRQLEPASPPSTSILSRPSPEEETARGDDPLPPDGRAEALHELPTHPLLSHSLPSGVTNAGNDGGPSQAEVLEAFSKGCKYPLASSDVQSDTLSSLDSIVSSEDAPSLSPKAPSTLPDSGNPSPSLDAASLKSSPFESYSSAPKFYPSKAFSDPLLRSPSACSDTGSRIRISIQIPRDLVGRFIGKQGKNIKSLMADSVGAHVYVDQRSAPDSSTVIPCYIQGSASQVNLALKIVACKFPSIEMPPSWLESEPPLSGPLPPIPASSPLSSLFSPKGADAWKVELPPVSPPPSPFHTVITYIESLSHVWLVLYESSAQLDDLHQAMAYAYSPSSPFESPSGSPGGTGADEADLTGCFCAVKVSDVHWLRGRVLGPGSAEGSFEVRLVDYGSTMEASRAVIKPLRSEHCVMPMQAFPCCLANVRPIGVPEDVLIVLQAMVEGMVLEAHLSGHTPGSPAPLSCPPRLELYSQLGSQTPTFINRELVEQGVAVWREEEEKKEEKEAESRGKIPPTEEVNSGEAVMCDGVLGEGVTGDGVTGEGVTGDGVTGEGVTGDGVKAESMQALPGAVQVES